MKSDSVGRLSTERAQPFPSQYRGRWCFVKVKISPANRPVRLTIYGGGRLFGFELVGIGQRRSGVLRAVFYAPADTETLRVVPVGIDTTVGEAVLWPLARWRAALLLIWRQPLAILDSLNGRPRGAFSRLRRRLAAGAVTAFYPRDYELWINLFDRWEGPRRDKLMSTARRAAWPSIEVKLFARDPRSPASHATHNSLANQWYPPVHVRSGDSPAGTADYLALVQAGEVLPPHALALLADHAAAMGWPDILTADEDSMNGRCTRSNPLFRAKANHALMLSGTLTRGVWLVRRDALVGEQDTGYAEAFRLELWLAMWRRGLLPSHIHVPAVLTHRRVDTEIAQPNILAAIVARHAGAADLPWRVTATFPLRLHTVLPPGRQERVAMLVPSRCRDQTTLICLRTVLACTAYTDFEIVLVAAQPDPPDAEQRDFAAALNDPRVRLLHVEMRQFNFAAAINRAVATIDTPWVLLLNDDVAPLDPDWLAAMAGHFADPKVGVVGTRLLYPDGTAQHNGIVMGLGGIGGHAGLLKSARNSELNGSLALDREVSAVTGACMLVRRSLIDALDGLDESYASAFNDVDFCLRAQKSGWQVVVTTQCNVVHHESLSFVSHYAAVDAHEEDDDMRRMNVLWGAWIERDPFHSSNAALLRWLDTEPAFPPLVDPLLECSVPSAAEGCCVDRLGVPMSIGTPKH